MAARQAVSSVPSPKPSAAEPDRSCWGERSSTVTAMKVMAVRPLGHSVAIQNRMAAPIETKTRMALTRAGRTSATAPLGPARGIARRCRIVQECEPVGGGRQAQRDAGRGIGQKALRHAVGVAFGEASHGRQVPAVGRLVGCVRRRRTPSRGQPLGHAARLFARSTGRQAAQMAFDHAPARQGREQARHGGPEDGLAVTQLRRFADGLVDQRVEPGDPLDEVAAQARPVRHGATGTPEERR